MSLEHGEVNQAVVDGIIGIYSRWKKQILEESGGWSEYTASRIGLRQIFVPKNLDEAGVELRDLHSSATLKNVALLLVGDNEEAVRGVVEEINKRDPVAVLDVSDPRAKRLIIALKKTLERGQ